MVASKKYAVSSLIIVLFVLSGKNNHKAFFTPNRDIDTKPCSYQ